MHVSVNPVKYNLTARDVAELYGYTEQHVRELAKENIIPHKKPGRAYKFNLEEVDAALREYGERLRQARTNNLRNSKSVNNCERGHGGIKDTTGDGDFDIDGI